MTSETVETVETAGIVISRLDEGQLAEAGPLDDVPTYDPERTRPIPAVRPQ